MFWNKKSSANPLGVPLDDLLLMLAHVDQSEPKG